MPQQYLPFVLREFVIAARTLTPGGLPQPTKTVVRVSSSEIGDDRPVHLGDLSVVAQTTGQQGVPVADSLMMRVGWRGRGYILERPIQIGAWMNKGRPLTGCWRLEKPYYLAANGAMQAVLQSYNSDDFFQGIVFNCTREDNGKPYYLYESTDGAVGGRAPNPVGLRKQHLKAPPDTGLFVHSVAVSEYTLSGTAATDLGVKITSPNSYQWVQVIDYIGGAAILPLYYQRWLGVPTSMFELGSERGWIIQPKQSLLIEFENRSDQLLALAITLRGSVEV